MLKLDLLRRAAVTLLAAIVGALLLTAAAVPGAWLVGAIIGTAVLVLAGFPAWLPKRSRDIGALVLGAAIGSALTPDMIARIPSYAGSIAVLLVSTSLGMMLASAYLVRVEGWSVQTARFSTLPGALSVVILQAIERGADVPRIAIAQIIRQWTVIGMLSLALAFGRDVAPVPVGETARMHPEVVVMLVICAAGAILIHRLWRQIGLLVGAMVISAALHGSGIISARVPQMLQIAAFVVLGAHIGLQLVGIDLAALLKNLRAGLVSAGLAVAVSAAFAAAMAHWVLEMEFWVIWLAYAPGGVDLMISLALALGLDSAFVAVHHLIRLLLINTTTSLWSGPRGG